MLKYLLFRNERKTLREIIKLKKMIANSNDEKEILKLEQQIKFCEALHWKDYKFFCIN